MAKILVVDDDRDLADTLKDLLMQDRHAVDAVYDGSEALAYLENGTFDLIVLDVQMPKMSGYEVLKSYRTSGGQAAVILLTSLKETQNKVEGLNTGADDYLTKPFDPDELIARVKAHLRRTPTTAYAQELTAGDLTVDVQSRTCKKGTEQIRLQPKEYALLEFFMRHQGSVFSAEALLERVWPTDSEVSPESLRYHMTNLRSKIDSADKKSFIETVHRVGYKFNAPA